MRDSPVGLCSSSMASKFGNVSRAIRWIQGIMGGNDSKYISESELSASESSLSDEYETPQSEIDELTVTVDAALGHSVSLPKAQNVLESCRVLEIENQLDIDEIVSLVFLLLEDKENETEYYLQALLLLLSGSSKKVLHEWSVVQDMRIGSNWQNKLIESLCIIKNYEILKSLGFQKSDAKYHYLPHVISTLHINKIRKALYLICEKLNMKKTTTFLEHVRRKFSEKRIPYFECDPQFLELYLMKWETTKTFSLTDVRSVLKTMEEEELYTMLNDILVQENVQRVEEPSPLQQFISIQGSSDSGNMVQNSQTSKNYLFQSNYLNSGKTSLDRKSSNTSMDNPVPQEFIDSNDAFMDYQLPHVGLASSSAHSDMSLKDNKYFIDRNHPGVVLIINQESFYTEIRREYKNLLPPDSREQLVSRKGTEKDKEELVKVFHKFGFKVIVEENISHSRLIQSIKDVLKGIVDESSLFICILSHGDKGVVYGANSCMVKVNEIKKLMDTINKNNLIGKPKVLIIQACQGLECQKLVDESGDECDEDNVTLTTDGPAPLLRDIITFYASVPGYAAIRSKKTGSWFIQALCNQMIQAGNRHHFADICTKTANEVAQQKWLTEEEIKTMTPIVETTLLKAFYLPPMRKIDSA